MNDNRTLKGRRILVPPSRPESNPLLKLLEKEGAETVQFPGLTAAPPEDYGPLDDTIRNIASYDWIIFSGSNCVTNYLSRYDLIHRDRALLTGPHIAAIGYGAVRALKSEAIDIQYIPNIHTARAVTEGLPDIYGKKMLLVRIEGAAKALPAMLKDHGADLTEVAGYRMIVDIEKDNAINILKNRLDAVALTNPTAMRFLVNGAAQAGINLTESLRGTMIAAVGPATAEAARDAGLPPDIVSEGHIIDLRNSLIAHYA